MPDSINSLSFLIPVYQNQGSIIPTFEGIKSLMKNGKFRIENFEVLFINDGSDDDSQKEIDSLLVNNNNIKSIELSRNFGQVPAIITGLNYIQSDIVIILSADLQDPVDLVHDMINAYSQGFEIVICSRKSRDDNFFNNFTSNFFYRLINLSNSQVPVGGFDFLLLSKIAYTAINQLNEHNRFFQGDVIWVGFRRKVIEYERQKRLFGKSQWSIKKKIKYFIDGILSTSYAPIRIMSLIGIIASISGFLYLLLIIYNRILNKTPFIGWAAIMGLILCFGGLIILMLGIIGEYVWRVYDETRNRPVTIIRKKQGLD